jgi:hypothetical protein
MEHTVTPGTNRTGMHMAPNKGAGMMDYANLHAGDATADQGQIQEMHRIYAQEADTVGSVPLPGTLKGPRKASAAKMRGEKTGVSPEVLIDKLGERLAFERTGTRLYEALIMKLSGLQGPGDMKVNAKDKADTHTYEALGSDGNLQAVGSRVDLLSLQRLRHEEQAHMHVVRLALEELGADPTAMTPSADIAGVTAMGVMQTLTDPRTTLAQCLNALLTAELTDHAGWELLMELAEDLGHDDMALRFSVAATTEAGHLSIVKDWLRTEVMTQGH